MKKNLLISLIIILGLHISCKKSEVQRSTNTTPLNPTDTSTTSALLKEVLILDTTLPVHDTISKISIFYDQQNRISSYNMTDLDSSGNTFNKNTFTYYYNGTDTVASRTILQREIEYWSPNVTADTTDFTYDAGKLIFDSTYTYVFGITPKFTARHFTYYPDYISMYDTSVDNSAGTGAYFTVSAKFHVTYSNGNLVHQIDTSYGHSQFQVFNGLHDETITYLSNPNPVYILSKPLPHEFLNYYFVYGVRERDDQPKLITSCNYWNNGDPAPQTITYDFRNDGLPIDAHQVLQFAVPNYRKYVYTYY